MNRADWKGTPQRRSGARLGLAIGEAFATYPDAESERHSTRRQRKCDLEAGPRRSLVIGPMSGSLRTTLRPLTIAEAAMFTAVRPRGLNRTNHDESRERRGPAPLTTVVSHQRLPSALLPSIADRVSLRNTHILLLPVIAVRTLASGLLSSPNHFPRRACTRGALLAPTKAGGTRRVVADIAKLSVGREAYYTRELATDHEQYLSGHGESPGRWYGAGATSLGLEGEASVAGFQAMFEGRHPTTGELLGHSHGRNAVPAFDVVLRPTKSVSILYGLGDPATGRAVLAAHHAGLAEAVAYLDGHLGARRGHGGVQHVSGQGLLAVGFDHRTSREGDPLLHTHLVVANRVQGPDGRWTALDGRDLYRHRLAADAIYRATYQRELVRSLGVEWTAADRHGNRELAGMPEHLVRSFSKRTDQIDAELDRLALDGRERTPRLVKWAVQATRKPKQHDTPDSVPPLAGGGGRAGRGPGHHGPGSDRPDTQPRPDSVRCGLWSAV
jgi:conjugative relaxase-like TrwC/TraI family protein